MTSAPYGQWQPTTPPFGATSATKMSEPVAGGAILTTRISDFGTDKIVDEHTDTTTTANGTTTVKSSYVRIHESDGPNIISTAHATITGNNLHLNWQLSFTDSQGLITHQVGATAQTFAGGVVLLTGVQSVSTSHPDGSATQTHIQWDRPNNTGDAIRRIETTDANDNTTTTSDHVWSSGNGPWSASGVPPTHYDNDPALDALPPPFGPMGPVFGGDAVFVMNEPATPG